MPTKIKSPTIEHISKPIRAKAKIPSFAHPETSPSFFENHGEIFINLSTAYTVVSPLKMGKKIKDLFCAEDVLDIEKSFLTCDSFCGYGTANTGGSWTNIEDYNSDECWKDGNSYWKRQYYGIFDAQMIEIKGAEYLLCIVHGENKNERTLDNKCYINNIQKKREYKSHEFSGPYEKDGQLCYEDYDGSYFAFLSMLIVPKDKCNEFFGKKEYDYGPISWPENGYIDENDIRINSGIRHPSMFVWEDYVYIYYLDQSKVRVIRANKNDMLGEMPFKVSVNGEFIKSSLPDGFSMDSRKFFDKGIGDIDALLDEDLQLRFSVSKVKGKDLFLGVEEYYKEWPISGIRFRTSTDLVHWSEPFSHQELEYDEYNKGTLHYPTLFNKDFTSREEVDLDDFIVMGIYGNNIGHPIIEYRKFKITID